jgi:molecular chaperone GrpE
MPEATDKKEERAEHTADVSGREVKDAKKHREEAAAGKKRKKPKEVRISDKEFDELKEKAALTDEYFDRLARLQADFENFRKRKEKERLEWIKYATEGLVCELVPILSNFERALAAAEKVSDAKRFAEGVKLIFKQLKKVLKDRGIEEICPLNAPFDPYKHEAVEKVVTDEHPEGHVVEVFQKGYALNDRVLQPAAVKVAASQESESEASEPETEDKDKESSSTGAEAKGNRPEGKTEIEISQD